jgi:hypothetical protein
MQQDPEAREVKQVVLRYLTEIYQNWVNMLRLTRPHA